MNAGLSLDGLTRYSEALWQEPSMDKLLRRFLKILRDEWSMVECLSWKIEQARPLQIMAEECTLRGVTSPGLDVTQDFLEQSKTVDWQSQEWRDGLHHLQICGAEWSVAVVGEQELGHLLMWRHGSTLNAEQVRGLDFLLRQMQCVARLLEKLDQTQALLYRDGLTGLYNYRYLDVALDAEIRRAQRFQSKFCLLFIDLDNFKPINDNYGHLSGSEVLKQVAEVVRDDLREVDSVFRYGGDEYVVLLLEATSASGAMTAERLRRKIEQASFRTEDQSTVHVTASIGVAACPEHGLSKELLLKMADQSMYKSKHGGKNRVFVISREMIEQLENKEKASS